jgi:hypothetical protein
MRKRSFFVLLALVFSSLAVQCQQLTVQSEAGKQVILNRSDLEALPHVKVIAQSMGHPRWSSKA